MRRDVFSTMMVKGNKVACRFFARFNSTLSRSRPKINLSKGKKKRWVLRGKVEWRWLLYVPLCS